MASEEDLILSVDFGSTHACARLYTKDLVSEAVHNEEAPLDPEEYWKILCKLIEDVLRPNKKLASAVRCFGLSVQRNSFLLWDRATSEPVTEMSCWHDTSASAFAAHLNQSRSVEAMNKSGRILYKILPSSKFKMISNYKLTGIFACTRLAHKFAENPEVRQTLHASPFLFLSFSFFLIFPRPHSPVFCLNHCAA
ncbi:unnamed protein product [Dibothriocephalus latus]|uniref:Carbohydrate kinase FGGY N-terminal domain-containing protein n=1 Tax=Dibothriocephalus latus TaxID=60516 RepID=A0A3P7LZC0_DIBLA|nr:unnamed protein product [Dibothriocephalus latus]